MVAAPGGGETRLAAAGAESGFTDRGTLCALDANAAGLAIGDPLFADSEFFDPRDILQVRYEMVRHTEEASLREAAERYGTSVPTCVRANRAFREGGLQALIPQRRGPRGAHKITAEILAFVEDHRTRHGPVGSRKLVPLIAERFGVTLHPRGLDKAIARTKKNSPRRS